MYIGDLGISVTERSTGCGEGATKAGERIWGFKTASDLQSRPRGSEPDGRKWRCFSTMQHNQSCGILHLSQTVTKWRLVCETFDQFSLRACTHFKVQSQCGASWFYYFLINVAFCLCEPVKIRLVFHSKHGLYTYTNTLQETHRQLGTHSHTQTHTHRRTDGYAHTHTETRTHSGIDSAPYVWGQFILPQVVPDWIWSESHYASPWLTLSCPTPPPTHTNTHLHMHIYTHTNALSKLY